MTKQSRGPERAGVPSTALSVTTPAPSAAGVVGAPPTDTPTVDAAPLRGARRVLRAVRLIHPFPTALNAVAAVLLAVVAAGGSPGASVLARLALTMFAAQAAIGAVNDIVDRRLDAATKPWKPLPAGAVTLGAARAVGALAIVVALGVGATFGPGAWLLSTAGLAVGLTYDLRLKRSAWAWITYAVALPLVPLWVWAAVGHFTPALLWVCPVGLLLGGALQLANTLPDLHGDSAFGVRGSAHRLGMRRARLVAWTAYASAIVLAAVIGLAVATDYRWLLAGCAGATLLWVGALGAMRWLPATRSLTLGWGLLAGGAAVLAVGWLAALP